MLTVHINSLKEQKSKRKSEATRKVKDSIRSMEEIYRAAQWHSG